MSRYEEACKKACAGCRARGQWFRTTAHYHSDQCTAPTIDAFAEQQAELRDKAWKAGAEAMREAIVEAMPARFQGTPQGDIIRALPIPEEPR